MKARKILSAVLAALMLVSTLAAGLTVGAADVTYSDVTSDMWAYDDIMYVTENGLMNGTGGSTFSPTVDVTRAMVVTVLYRMEGSPEVKFATYFGDVADNEFYSDATVWAKKSDIVTSTGFNEWGEELFSPTRAITRQELATMFVRYAEYRYVITENLADISGYKDVGDVASWAEKAMQWCNESGLINGTGNGDTLSPKMTATREQFAAIIHRFKEAEFEYQYVFNQPKPLSTYTEKDYPLVTDADIYVAVDGSDKNPGTFEKPIATFKKAVEMVRELKKTAKDGIVVAFKAGNYGNLQIELTEADSGSEDVPITYCKYGDGDVLFSNGVTATIDEFTELDESDYYLFPEKSLDKIMKADMSGKDTIGNLTGMSSLFSEEKRIDMARFPNKTTGNDKSISYVVEGTSVEGGLGKGAWACKINSIGAKKFDSYHTYDNIVAIGVTGHEYDADYMVIGGYDPDTDTLTYYATDNVYQFGSYLGDMMFYMNISEELDTDNEYWFDPTTETLYVYAPEYNTYTLATAGTFLTVTDADYLNFIGLDFKHTTDNAIIVKADHVTFDQVEIHGVDGRKAMLLEGYNNALTNSSFKYLAGAGVEVVGGDCDFVIHNNTVVDNNEFIKFAEFYQAWTPAVGLYDCVGATVSHNHIEDSPHAAIVIGWDLGNRWRAIDNIIEYNYINDCVNSWYTDMGTIYIGRTHADRDNTIRYNIIANSGQSSGAWSIYYDDGVCGQNAYSNIFFNPGSYAVLMSGGRDNYICDNVMVQDAKSNNDNYPLRIWSKYGGALAVDGAPGGTWGWTFSWSMKRIPTDPEALAIWQERWPELFETIADVKYLDFNSDWDKDKVLERIDDPTMMMNSAGCTIKDNYAFGYPLECQWIYPEVEAIKFNDYENNPVYDHGNGPEIFVNPAQGDYSIREDCGVEIEDNQFSKIGRY